MRRLLILFLSLLFVAPSCAQDDFFSILASPTPGADLTLGLRSYIDPAFSPVTGTNDWNGRTSMVDLGTRQLLVFREAVNHSTGPGSWNIRYSQDGFQTSTANNTLIGGGSSSFFPYAGGTAPSSLYAEDANIFKCPNGDVLFISQQTAAANAWITHWQHRSTDGGNTWSSEGDLFSKIPSIGAASKFWAFFDSMIIGSDLYLVFAEYSTTKDVSKVRLVKSTDNGATYTSVSEIFPYAAYVSNPNETAIEHLGGGHVIAIARTWDLLHVLQRESFDYGATWGSVSEISVSKFNSFGLHQPRLHKFSSDNPNRLWLTARWYDGPDDTKNIICYSDDAASTWRIFQLSATWPGDTGYVDMIKRADGTYYISAYTGTDNAATVVSYVLEAYDSTLYGTDYNTNILAVANAIPYPIPSHHWRQKQNLLYEQLDAAGIFTKTDVFVVGMQDGSSNYGLMNWVSMGTALAAQPANQYWISGAGWRNSGSSGHTVLNWAPLSGVNFTQNSAAWATGHSGFTPPGAAFGSESTSNVNRMIFQGASTTTAQAPINSAGGVLTYQLHNAGRYYGERTASNATQTFYNNSSINTTSTVSAARSNKLIFITAFQNASSSVISAMLTGEVQYLWFGAPLTSTERGNFDSIMTTYTTP